MLRWGLLGGERPPLPWEFFVALGGAIVVVCPVLFALLYPWWRTLPVLGLGELATFLAVGGALLAIGGARRADARRPAPSIPPPPPRHW